MSIMICMREGCCNVAMMAVKLTIPHEGALAEAREPMSLVMGLFFCRLCAEAVTAEEFIGGDPERASLRPHIEVATWPAMLDFEAATVSPVAFDSPDFLDFKARQRAIRSAVMH